MPRVRKMDNSLRWIREYVATNKNYPAATAVHAATGLNINSAYMAIRRVRAENNEPYHRRRDSGRVGEALQWVRDYRDVHGQYPTSLEINADTGFSLHLCHEALARVRAERHELDTRKPLGMLTDNITEYVTTYYDKHKSLPRYNDIVQHTNASYAMVCMVLRDVKKQLGINGRSAPRRVVGTTRDTNRSAEVAKTYSDLMAAYPAASTGGLLVATAAVLGISKQRVHQVLILES